MFNGLAQGPLFLCPAHRTSQRMHGPFCGCSCIGAEHHLALPVASSPSASDRPIRFGKARTSTSSPESGKAMGFAANSKTKDMNNQASTAINSQARAGAVLPDHSSYCGQGD
ncbi:hypothetical protein SORBI_3006G187700 [Sorghum bicolor]|uniref:Uncharacterized protein n=1 Tax=Sorghum bicolor TaxID=4558 RepID=A0A1B6PMR9_SORBI|nr:hypothetical protein SORBI_3006G187700 [Sorghum bicolor]